MAAMLVDHVIAAAKSFAKILALIAGQVGVTEGIVPVRIRRPSRVNVVTRRIHAVVKTAVPCMGPVAFRFHRLPDSRRWRTLLRMNGQSRSA